MIRDVGESWSCHHRVEVLLHPMMVQPYCRTLHAMPSLIYARSYPCRHSFRMRQQFRRVDDDRRRPYFQMMMEVFLHLLELHLVRRLDDKARHLDVVLHLVRQLGVQLVLLGVLQILDEQNLVVLLPFLDVVHLLVDARLDAMVAVLVVVALADVEQRQLRMDCYPHVVGEEGSLFRRLQLLVQLVRLVRLVLVLQVLMVLRQQVLRVLLVEADELVLALLVQLEFQVGCEWSHRAAQLRHRSLLVMVQRLPS
jgi:hypothetical protein